MKEFFATDYATRYNRRLTSVRGALVSANTASQTERGICHFPKISSQRAVGPLSLKGMLFELTPKLNKVIYLLERRHGIKLVHRWLC